MTCLALDTAGPFCSTALVSGAGTLALESEQIGRGHAERLMPMIEDILQRAGCAYRDLDRIAVTTGPGSFTGVRIGISAARGLALALGIDAVGIGVLDALAEQALRSAPVPVETTIVAALSAARGEMFVQATTCHDAPTRQRTVILPAVRMAAEDARQWVGRLTGEICLIGSAAPDLMASARPSPALVEPADHADIAVVAELARAGIGSSPPRPLYLRAPDARPQAGKAIAHA